MLYVYTECKYQSCHRFECFKSLGLFYRYVFLSCCSSSMVVFLWLGYYVQDNIQYREPPFQPRVGKDILPIYSSAGQAGRQRGSLMIVILHWMWLMLKRSQGGFKPETIFGFIDPQDTGRLRPVFFTSGCFMTTLGIIIFELI